ncbi:BolA family protein [Aquabacter spiritensis]|uniref:BolA protein family transcriptional regulator n=1 Tax=Aquabacter spiritensis TaxID=933073 RepID=A0A4V2UYM8_9HYPH|nr:BolA family protein [Aquabacter spiritensis]TCT08038.1 BolA protein family transcriptional regulator [Aquabacter spiritensis]
MSDLDLARIRATLSKGLTPLALEVEDESAHHAGHAGATSRADGGITHLRVRAVAEAFRGKSRVDRHRLVNALLSGEMAQGLHALAIEAKAPGE